MEYLMPGAGGILRRYSLCHEQPLISVFSSFLFGYCNGKERKRQDCPVGQAVLVWRLWFWCDRHHPQLRDEFWDTWPSTAQKAPGAQSLLPAR